MPLPFKSPQSVNAYVVEADDGLLLLDCGTDWKPGHDALVDGFEALELELSAVDTLVVSHLHPDHVGMATRLVRELGCRLVMHESASRLVDEYNDTPGYYQRLRGIARSHGVPDAIVEAAASAPRPDYMPLIDPPDHTVADGDRIPLGTARTLEVVHTPGHDASHICLKDSKTGIVFSGDHVLPRISPVIMYELDGGDALGDYLSGLRRLIDMGMVLTYPAHGDLIDRGDERARQILLHHDRRLLDMAAMVRDDARQDAHDGTTAWEVMLRAFRPNLDPLQARLAFLETIAHLEHLARKGRIRRHERGDRVVYTT